MAKAIITLVKPKGSHKQGLIAIQHNLNQNLKARGISGVSVRKVENSLVVPLGLPREMLESFLEKINIDHVVEYIESENIKINGASLEVPEDYGRLKGQVKDLRLKVSGLESEVLTLSEENEAEKVKSRDAVSKFEEFKGFYENMSVDEFLAESILKENKKWQEFVKSYSSFIDAAEQIYGKSASELENAALNLVSLGDRKEFKRLKSEYDAAVQAIETQKSNKFLNLDPEAERVIKRVEEMEKEDQIYRELNKELRSYVPNNPLRFGFAVCGNYSKLILPFKSSASSFIEKDLVSGIGVYLDEKAQSSNKTSYKGLLVYELSIKPRAKTSLINLIVNFEDRFSKLGGKREVVRVENYIRE